MDNSTEFLTVVYDRLRNFAKSRFNPNDSLCGTELLHEAYLRVAHAEEWDSQAHFFASMRIAMRNVIVDHLRKKSTEKHGGKYKRVDFERLDLAGKTRLPEIVVLSEVLDKFAEHDERAANIVTLRFFACMTEDEIAQELGISRRTVLRDWIYAKSWLKNAMEGSS